MRATPNKAGALMMRTRVGGFGMRCESPREVCERVAGVGSTSAVIAKFTSGAVAGTEGTCAVAGTEGTCRSVPLIEILHSPSHAVIKLIGLQVQKQLAQHTHTNGRTDGTKRNERNEKKE